MPQINIFHHFGLQIQNLQMSKKFGKQQLDFTTITQSQLSGCPTFRSAKPKQKENLMQQKARNSENPKLMSSRQQNKFLISNISLSSDPYTESIEFSDYLSQLQQKLVEEILALREDKITLMEQHNICIKNKLKVQRDITKIKKKIQEKQQSKNNSLVLQNQREILQHSQYIIEQKQYYDAKQPLTPQQMQLSKKILNLKRYNEQLLRQLVESSFQSVEEDRNKKQQFILLPTSLKIQQNKSGGQSVNDSDEWIKKLKAKREKLLQLIMSQTKQPELKQCLINLIKSNHELQAVVDWHLYQQKYVLQMLRDSVKRQEAQKQQFLQELISLKSQTRHLRIENEQLRKAMIYFRF